MKHPEKERREAGSMAKAWNQRKGCFKIYYFQVNLIIYPIFLLPYTIRETGNSVPMIF